MKRIITLTVAAAMAAATVSAMTILFIGDSITDGNWGNPVGYPCPTEARSTTDMNHIYGHGYMFLIASQFQGETPEKGYRFYNRGISGNTLDDMEARWHDDVIAHSPDVVSILIGTNDVHRYIESDRSGPFDFDSWEKRYRALLDITRDSLPEVRFVLGSPFTAYTGNMRNYNSTEDFNLRKSTIEHLDSIVEKIAADYGAVFVPYHELFKQLGNDYPALPDNYWIWDGIHPTPSGHRKMADMWLNNTTEIFKN